MVDLEKIRVFYYVAIEGSVLNAAASLGLSSSAVSRHLSDLEAKLNKKLFVRKKTGLILTADGEKLFYVAKQAVRNLEEITQEMLTDQKPTPKTLRIVTTTGHGCLWLVQKMKPFIENYPDLNIKIYTTDDPIEFSKSNVDVAITIKVLDPEKTTMRKLWTFHMGLIAAPEYIEKHGMPQSIEDLDNHKVLGFYYDRLGGAGNIDAHLSIEGHKIAPHITINNGPALMEAARLGYGIWYAILEYPFLKGLPFVSILEEATRTKIDYYFITQADILENRTLTDLFDCLCR